MQSKPDSLDSLRQKIRQFLELGTQVGVLVDPRTQTLEVYRPEQDAIVLRGGDILTAPELLPGWEMEVSSIWSPVFDEE